jgi:hypothetical protein
VDYLWWTLLANIFPKTSQLPTKLGNPWVGEFQFIRIYERDVLSVANDELSSVDKICDKFIISMILVNGWQEF